MTPDELRVRIQVGENVHTDFTERLGTNTDVAKDLVCLANSTVGS
jgi:hypothetical protein